MRIVLIPLCLLCVVASGSTIGQGSYPKEPTNTLLRKSRLVTSFGKSYTEEWTGYQWVSHNEIVFQRKGGYVKRNVETGTEEKVKGYPEQDKAHWFGGNLRAQFAPDGNWILYHGRRGNEEWDDGALRVDRTDGSASIKWPADKFPEIAAGITYWLSDNVTWVCPTTWNSADSGSVSGVVMGSVKAPDKVRRIPWDKGVGDNWDIIATGRDRLYAIPSSTERKPPAISSLRVTEMILGKTVIRGRSWLLRFGNRVHAFCDAGISSKGTTLWTLVVKGNPWHGERPLVTVVAVWRPGQGGLREVGRLVTAKNDDEDFCEPSYVRWLPDGTHFSFQYRHSVYTCAVPP